MSSRVQEQRLKRLCCHKYVFLQAGLKEGIVTMIGGCALVYAGSQALLCRMEIDYLVL